MTDEEMVAYLGRCQLDPAMPRPSIETLLHAFIPPPHVDHTHPDAIGVDRRRARRRALAESASAPTRSGSPTSGPGSPLEARRRAPSRPTPASKLVLLAKHGLVTWGDRRGVLRGHGRGDQPRGRVRRGAGRRHARFGGARPGAELTARHSRTLLGGGAAGAARSVSADAPALLQVDPSPAGARVRRPARRRELSQVGAACPDHLVHTKRRPLWVRSTPRPTTRRRCASGLVEEVHAFQRARAGLLRAPRRPPSDKLRDPSPRVVADRGRRPRRRRAHGEGRAARARSLPACDRRDARRRRRSAASSRWTTRSRSRSSTGRSSSTSSRWPRRRGSSRASSR